MNDPYLLREQGGLTILKCLPNPDLIFHLLKMILPRLVVFFHGINENNSAHPVRLLPPKVSYFESVLFLFS